MAAIFKIPRFSKYVQNWDSIHLVQFLFTLALFQYSISGCIVKTGRIMAISLFYTFFGGLSLNVAVWPWYCTSNSIWFNYNFPFQKYSYTICASHFKAVCAIMQKRLFAFLMKWQSDRLRTCQNSTKFCKLLS